MLKTVNHFSYDEKFQDNYSNICHECIEIDNRGKIVKKNKEIEQRRKFLMLDRSGLAYVPEEAKRKNSKYLKEIEEKLDEAYEKMINSTSNYDEFIKRTAEYNDISVKYEKIKEGKMSKISNGTYLQDTYNF